MIQLRITEQEKRDWRRIATYFGQDMSNWIRGMLNMKVHEFDAQQHTQKSG